MEKPTTPFPGFSLDHFNYGLQMGMDNHGNSQHPWDSPFQNPYPNEEGMGINPPGQPGMGSMPGPGMGVGPQGPTPTSMGSMGPYQPQQQQQQSQQQPPPPMGNPQDQYSQQQQGPSPYGVWGDKDLINDPDYAQAAYTKHPKWSRFLQYMNTPEAKDSMMMGVIMSRIGEDPKGTMQLALQFREQQAARSARKQQAQAQREYGLEVAKLKSETQKSTKEESQFNSNLGKLDAAIRSAKIDPDEIIKTLGPPTKENLPDWQRAVQQGVNVANQKVQEAKVEEQNTKQKGVLINQAHSVGDIPPSKFTNPDSPEYDDAFTDTINKIKRGKVERDNTYADHMRFSNDLLQKKTELMANARTPENKDRIKVMFERANVASSLAKQAKAVLEQMRPYSQMEGGFKDSFLQAQSDYNTRMSEWNTIMNQIGEISGNSSEAPAVKPVGEVTTTTGTPTPTAAPPTAAPSDMDIATKNYRLAVKAYGKAATDEIWKKKYTVPPPSEN